MQGNVLGAHKVPKNGQVLAIVHTGGWCQDGTHCPDGSSEGMVKLNEPRFSEGKVIVVPPSVTALISYTCYDVASTLNMNSKGMLPKRY